VLARRGHYDLYQRRWWIARPIERPALSPVGIQHVIVNVCRWSRTASSRERRTGKAIRAEATTMTDPAILTRRSRRDFCRVGDQSHRLARGSERPGDLLYVGNIYEGAGLRGSISSAWPPLRTTARVGSVDAARTRRPGYSTPMGVCSTPSTSRSSTMGDRRVR